MTLILSWIRNNKFKFLIYDFLLLIGNVIILNFIQNNYFIDIDIILSFITINIFLGFVFCISKIWIWVTRKYHFIFIRVDDIGEVILYFGMILFVILNIILLFLIWIYKNLDSILYFSMPWIIIILVNAYNSIIYNKNEITNRSRRGNTRVIDTKFEGERQAQ
jgi:hypothetical protein